MKASSKFAAAAVAAIVGAIGLAGCSGDNAKYAAECEGTWLVETLMYEGELATAADMVEEGTDMEQAYSITLDEDGTATAVIWEEKTTGTWKPTDRGCAITFEGETEVAPIESGKLILGNKASRTTFVRG